MINPHDFVAFDLETTGLNPKSHEIIECGAVCVRKGKPVERYRSFVKPSGHIPDAITRLTSISDDDVCDAHFVGDVLVEFVEFTGNDTLVAHNASFDVGFLKIHTEIIAHRTVIDNLELARIVLPRLINHKLQTLGKHFKIESGNHHRALDDAELTAGVFVELLKHLETLPLEILSDLSRLAEDTGSSLADYFAFYRNKNVQKLVSKKIRSVAETSPFVSESLNVSGKAPDAIEDDYGKSTNPLDSGKIRALFESGGSLEKKLENYEPRIGQMEMSENITRSLNRNEFLIYEAGTGIGKSFAYLIPSAIWTLTNKERIVISTNTQNLQEQLFFKDIPIVKRIINNSFKSVLLKGRGNYLCINKYRRIISPAAKYLSRKERHDRLPLIVWLHETKTGDLSEVSSLKRSSVIEKIRSEHTSCIGRNCSLKDKCYVTRIRKAALSANLIVINHSLLFSDMSADNTVLGPYNRIVFDEAHHLEKVAIQHLGKELDAFRLRIIIRKLYSSEAGGIGILSILQERLEKLATVDKNARPWFETSGRLQQKVESFFKSALYFFDSLQKIVRETSVSSSSAEFDTQKVRYTAQNNPFKKVSEEMNGCMMDITDIRKDLEELLTYLSTLKTGTFDDLIEVRQELDARSEELLHVQDDLQFLSDADGAFVFWIEVREKKNIGKGYGVKICSAPLDIAERLAKELYTKLDTAVFTSATLTVAGKFDFLARKLGLDLVEKERVQYNISPSPFDYKNQALVLLPVFIPPPNDKDFIENTINFLGDFLLEVKRAALVLFTSRSMLQRMYYELYDFLKEKGIILLGQGIDGSRDAIMRQFKNIDKTILFGMDSFWEGVDIPGRNLENLVIMRLPFPVPSEPIIEAQSEEIARSGKNPFFNLMVPEAIIRFRQGFGRLIRTGNDRGIILVMDTRLEHARYGNLFRESLPVSVEIGNTPDDILNSIHNWFSTREKVE